LEHTIPASPHSSTAITDAPADRAGLAHDARNLLGALNLYCDLLELPGVIAAEFAGYTGELRLLGQRSGVMIDRLLACEPLPSPGGGGISVPAVLLQCSGLFAAIAGSHVTLQIECAPTASEVTIPITQESFERILVNLVRNAATALADATQPCYLRIEVLTVQPSFTSPNPPNGLILTVSDTGCGMDADTLDRLLHPTGPNSSPRGPGMGQRESDRDARGTGMGARGIGINVVRDLVARSGGVLRITSALDTGTCVEIVWPAIPPPPPGPESPDPHAKMAHSAQSSNGQQPDTGHSSAVPVAHCPPSTLAATAPAEGRILC